MSTNNRFDPYPIRPEFAELIHRAEQDLREMRPDAAKLREALDTIARLTEERDAAVRAVELGTVVEWEGACKFDTWDRRCVILRVGRDTVLWPHVGQAEYRLSALTDGLRVLCG